MKKILIFISIIQCSTALAWNDSGHQIIAAIAWDLLDDKQQKHWVDILKHHPRFKQDFKQQKPADVEIDSQQYNEWIFRHAATWPDVARKLPNNIKEKFHRGPWHYINYPLFLDKKVNTKFVNLNINYKGKSHNNLNITQALKANIATLSKQGATKEQKALALSWLLHLTGDSHQPLHSTALFSKKYFPKGDRGGNLITIGGQGKIENLHWYWDTRLDNSQSFKIIDLKAKKLNEKHQEEAKNHQKNNIHKWIANAHVYAKNHVYTPHILRILRENEQHNRKQPVIRINNEYDKKARLIAEIQATKAAYKLVELLNTHQP